MKEKSRSVCLFGAALDTGNMGVSALAASLIKAIVEVWPNADISLLVGNRSPSEHELEVGDRTVRVKVVNYRLSPASGLGKHLFWIFLMACIRRMLPAGILRSRITEANEWLRALAQADLVGDIRGGDGFSDIYGIRRMVIGSMPSIIAILMQKPPVLLPQTFGPFESRFSRFLARFILSRSALVLSRDREGLRTVETLCGDQKPSSKPKYCPDVAFLLDSRKPDRFDAELSAPANSTAEWVGLNINGLMYNGGYSRDNMFGLKANYREFTMELIERLLTETTSHILLIPHSFGRPEHIDSDVGACMDVLRAKGHASEGRLHAVAGEYDQHEIKGIIGQCEFFIGSRMHSCIAALSQGIPTVGVAYSSKFRGVFESVRAEAMVVDLRFLDLETAAGTVMREYWNRSKMKPVLEQNVIAVKRRIRAAFRELLVNR